MICTKSIKNKKISTEKKLGKKIGISERDWGRGDIVKIDCAWFAGAETDESHRGLGIILARALSMGRQEQLFPTFHVYDLTLQTAKKYYSYDLEIISTV